MSRWSGVGPAHPRRRRTGGAVPTSAITSAAAPSSSTRPARFVNREEFTPYGEPCFGGFARKRYRFTGQERDEESGLSRHGLRRYAPWLGSWTSCDPNGAGMATSPYAYANGNPIRLVDPDGLDGQEPRLNFSFGLTFTVGSLEQNLSLNASVTTQVPIGPLGLEGGARADLSLSRKRMGGKRVGRGGRDDLLRRGQRRELEHLGRQTYGHQQPDAILSRQRTGHQ